MEGVSRKILGIRNDALSETVIENVDVGLNRTPSFSYPDSWKTDVPAYDFELVEPSLAEVPSLREYLEVSYRRGKAG